jgi:RNA polymerase sigma-70 factor, ECF subfamily
VTVTSGPDDQDDGPGRADRDGQYSTDSVIGRVWRDQAPRVIGGLLRMTHDLDLAEDLAHDALVAALEQWPATGVPDNPGAWLMAVAKRRAVDHFRRSQRLTRVQAELGRHLITEEAVVSDPDAAVDHIEDDVLRLMLVSCHPVLSTQARVALTLRLIGGLTTKEIARAFLAPEPTIGRRISRAKRALADAGVPFEVPDPAERAERLPSVLHVIYLIFTEGYAATAGDDWMRPAMCDEAIRLGLLVARLFPREPEVHGLVALMYLQASRSAARTDDTGAPVLLGDQDRSRWDRSAIRRGEEALDRCLRLGGPAGAGPYGLQAGIAACHARATELATTDWARIAGLYDELAILTPVPVVRLNRAVAHGMAFGPATGLDLIDEIAAEPSLGAYHLLPSVRGDLLFKLDRRAEARAEFQRAAALAGNARERTLLLARAAACDEP